MPIIALRGRMGAKKDLGGYPRSFINVGSDLLSRLRTTIGVGALASEFGKGSGVSHRL